MDQNEFIRQLAHADVLLSQGRFSHAEEILERLMATGYEGTEIIKMMTVARMGLRKYSQAEELCKMLISHHPNEAFAFYTLSNIKASERNFTEAQSMINEAIRLSPANADFHAFKANILLQTKDYDQALESADRALNADAESIDALNARASALLGLNRKEEAFRTIDKSLATDPDHADTHANMGWGLLHRGQSVIALEHFKTALQLEPLNSYARSGMLEAIKARFPVYRYFLMLMLWMGKMKANNQWGLIIGGFVLYRVLLALARNIEMLQPFLIPLIALIGLFFISTWIFSPLMNLYLLTNPYGRLTLDAEQKESARLVGVALLLSLLLLLTYVTILTNEGLLSGALFAFALMIPFGSMNNAVVETNRRKLRYATAVITVLMLVDTILALVSGTFMSSLFFLPVIGLVGYQWYANYILIRE